MIKLGVKLEEIEESPKDVLAHLMEEKKIFTRAWRERRPICITRCGIDWPTLETITQKCERSSNTDKRKPN